VFTPIDRLPTNDNGERQKVQERWDSPEGRRTHERVLALIGEGAGEDFLQSAFEYGELPTLENMWDLRGLNLVGHEYAFPAGDTFEAIDFSYAHFTHLTLRNACFPQTYMGFGRVYGCRFVNCLFAFANFYGTRFENCVFESCDFIEHNEFLNCDCRNVRFERCFFAHALFRDCRFDSRCTLNPPRKLPVSDFHTSLDNGTLADFYLGASEAFSAGGVAHVADGYLFKSLKATRQYNSPTRVKPLLWANETITGYGLRPARVLGTMAAVLVAGSVWFARDLPWRDALLLASGAMLTFGASTDRLKILPIIDVVAYLLLAFGGVMLSALFVTTAARRIFTRH
jgi:hypothetical protein